MSTYDEADNGGFVPSVDVLAERQRGLARSVGDLLRWRNGRDGMEAWRAITDERVGGLEHKIDTLTKTVDSLRRVILGFAFSVAGSAIVFAFSILLATGKI